MKYAAIITLYYPDSSTADRIKEYLKVFDTVYLFDNTDNSDYKFEIPNARHLIYISFKENLGLPFAFNYVIGQLDKEINFICTLDQDSIFKTEDVLEMIKKIEKNEIEKLGILCPKVIYDNKLIERKKNIRKINFCICSGSFINCEVIRRLSIKYDEKYFIDRFDVDFCKQVINNGYYVFEYSGAFLFQQLGEKSNFKHPNHSILRHYYIFRNRLYFNKKYIKNFFNRIIVNFLQISKHIILILLFENNKINKIKQLKRAYFDYKKNRMGKFIN